jgi:Cys-rich four helix bundle protein (predicted Tat secretion target)
MTQPLDRRDLITGLTSLGALLVAGSACAQQAPAKDPHAGHQHGPDAPPPGPLPAGLAGVIESTAACARDGRVCLARCTEHLAAGMKEMADCQRAVMNMLAVSSAMADVAAYRNATPELMKALAKTCAAFCRACAEACKAHAAHHAECKACMDSCLACAKACEAFAA